MSLADLNLNRETIRKIELYSQFTKKFYAVLKNEEESEKLAKFVAFSDSLPRKFKIILDNNCVTVDISRISVSDCVANENSSVTYKVDGCTVGKINKKGHIEDIDIIPDEFVVRDFSIYFGDVEIFDAKLRFRGLFKANTPIFEFLTPNAFSIINQVVFYADRNNKFSIGIVEDITEIETKAGGIKIFITGVPVINNAPVLSSILPARLLGLPSGDVETTLLVLKLEAKRIEGNYISIEYLEDVIKGNIENAGISNDLDIIVRRSALNEALVDRLLWKIASDVLGI